MKLHLVDAQKWERNGVEGFNLTGIKSDNGFIQFSCSVNRFEAHYEELIHDGDVEFDGSKAVECDLRLKVFAGKGKYQDKLSVWPK